jgi:hypothetical protein
VYILGFVTIRYESDRNQHAERERPRSVDHVFEPAAMSRVGLSSARCAYTRRFTSGISKAVHRSKRLQMLGFGS